MLDYLGLSLLALVFLLSAPGHAQTFPSVTGLSWQVLV